MKDVQKLNTLSKRLLLVPWGTLMSLIATLYPKVGTGKV